MLQVSNVRQTRVYQEALEEGMEKARTEMAMTLLEMDLANEMIIKATGLTSARFRKLKKRRG